jgi:enoyl-CoA hydratase/carnithine racemase
MREEAEMLEVTRADGGVTLVRMKAGENRIHREFLEAWRPVLDELESDPGPLALVTTGEGKFFSNGLDLDWLRTRAADPGGFISEFCSFLGRLVALPCITVAAINGHAFAAGGMLALAHDVRIMREDRGYFCLPEVDLGVPLAPGMLALIRERLSSAVASEAILTGKRWGGRDAAARQIAHEAVPEAAVLERASHVAKELAQKNPHSVRGLKASLYAELLSALRRPQTGS